MNTRARLSIDLGEIKPRWDDWCALHDVTPAQGVRQLILDAVAADEPNCRAGCADFMRSPPVGEHRERLEIRLTRPELHAVERQATTCGFTANRWVVAMIRAQLTHVPQFGEQEMVLLAASNHALARISRSLGPVIREIDRDGTAADAGNARLLVELKTQIDAHLRAVSGLLRANIDRWSR
ncbi:plasmid stabilization protein [Caballeronia sp. LjRoot29]|uniref:plasmid stabilization protein n=1 Tax=Caballeronia sp. LjRoot29 TaxID=3342315 RepID=UPI003ECF9523